MESAGIGQGDTEQAAAQAALNNYFRRRNDAETAKQSTSLQISDDIPEVPIHSADSWLARKVAVSAPEIRAMLSDAMSDGKDVLISGVKVDDERYDRRRVTPRRFETRNPGFGRLGPNNKYLVAFERTPVGPEFRTFKLDGISRVESV